MQETQELQKAIGNAYVKIELAIHEFTTIHGEDALEEAIEEASSSPLTTIEVLDIIGKRKMQEVKELYEQGPFEKVMKTGISQVFPKGVIKEVNFDYQNSLDFMKLRDQLNGEFGHDTCDRLIKEAQESHDIGIALKILAQELRDKVSAIALATVKVAEEVKVDFVNCRICKKADMIAWRDTNGVVCTKCYKTLYFRDNTTRSIARPGPKIGRNEPCICGSDKKYKRCCG